jgi:hypothetical protein
MYTTHCCSSERVSRLLRSVKSSRHYLSNYLIEAGVRRVADPVLAGQRHVLQRGHNCGLYRVEPGDYLQVTYSVAPTMTKILDKV